MHTLKKEQTKLCASNCYDSVVWNSSKALFRFFNNRNTKRRHRKIPQLKQLLHRWKTNKSMMNLTFTLKKKWSKLLTPQQELEKKKNTSSLRRTNSSNFFYLAVLTCTFGASCSGPWEAGARPRWHPGGRRGTSWTGHAATLRAPPTDRVSSSPLWHVFQEWEEAAKLAVQERTRKGAATKIWNVILPSGSCAAMLPTISARITEMILVNVWRWSWREELFSASLWQLHFFLQLCSTFFLPVAEWTPPRVLSQIRGGEMPSKLTCHSTSFLQIPVKEVIAAAKTCMSWNAAWASQCAQSRGPRAASGVLTLATPECFPLPS